MVERVASSNNATSFSGNPRSLYCARITSRRLTSAIPTPTAGVGGRDSISKEARWSGEPEESRTLVRAGLETMVELAKSEQPTVFGHVPVERCLEPCQLEKREEIPSP